jgi:hypothetical protein
MMTATFQDMGGKLTYKGRPYKFSGLEVWLLTAPLCALLQAVQVVIRSTFPQLLIEALNSVPSGQAVHCCIGKVWLRKGGQRSTNTK